MWCFERMRSAISSWTVSLRQVAAPSSDPAAVTKDLQHLERLRQRIQARIDDPEARDEAPGGESSFARRYLAELRDVALDADDVLDEWHYELLCDDAQQEEGGAHERKRTEAESDRALRLLADNAPLRDHLAGRIGDIRRSFDEISSQYCALGLGRAEGPWPRGSGGRRPSSSLVDERYVYDMSYYKDAVVAYMLSDDCATSDHLSVIPIVGTGLTGKTTLAQLIYKDPNVIQRFHPVGWMSLTRDSDLMNLLQRLIESLTSEPCPYAHLEPIQKILQRCLMGKMLLLVLDDFCGENLYFWSVLKAVLFSCSRGSVVLVTTQNGEVAKRLQTVPPLYLYQRISNYNCWLVFKRYAFDGQDAVEGPDMVGLRGKVVEISEGVPSVAKLLGVSFRKQGHTEPWMDFMDNVVDEEIVPALQSSYQRLPAYLKPCLLYCSLFPKGYEFSKDQLVRLWIAQGLIRSGNKQQPEDIGTKYFGELLSGSFFLQSETDGLKYFLPNLIRDLIYSISRNEHRRLCGIEDKKDLPQKVRHLSLVCESRIQCESFYQYRSLRSFLVMRASADTSVVDLKVQHKMFHQLNHLRSLDLSYTNLDTLPDSIGNLKHLRLLALNHTKIKRLPESIHKLYNLQILEIKKCSCLQELPRGISSLINLRHLDVDSDYAPLHMPFRIQKLTSLQKLPAFNLQKGNEFGALTELRDLKSLKELGLSGLCNVTNIDDAKEVDMRNKTHLKILKLVWPSIDVSDHQNNLNLSDETDEEDEQNVGDEQYCDDGKASACDVDDKAERQVGFADEQESNISSIQLGDGISNVGIQDYVSSGAAVCKEDLPENLHPSTDLERLCIKSCDVDDKAEKLVGFPDEQESNFSSIQSRDGIRNVVIQDSVSSCAADYEVALLESLHPFKDLEKLYIKSYGGLRFPGWIGDSSFSKLIYVEFQDCKCAALPPLGQLKCLRFLSINGMPIKQVGGEFCGSGSANAFPKLETLSFHNMNNWENWIGVKAGDFPNLNKLYLFNCPQLTSVPNLLPSLKILVAERCMELTRIPELPSLEVLDLHCCDGLTTFPNLDSLCSLTIMHCQKLKSLPLLPNLKNLWLDDCEELNIDLCSCCPVSDLNDLLISNCPRLRFLPKEPIAQVQSFNSDGRLILSKWNETQGNDD